jgi:hypothetical protein
MENHKVYYRKESGATSQKLRTIYNLCLKLSLLNLSHHLHSTCTNRLFSFGCVGWLSFELLLMSLFYSWSSNMPLILEMLWVRKHVRFLFFSLFHFKTHIWIFLKVWGRVNIDVKIDVIDLTLMIMPFCYER